MLTSTEYARYMILYDRMVRYKFYAMDIDTFEYYSG